jgi:NAD(P)-dependent dehydrogenase (short-subunit alcohol dehydrogenase family)
VASDGGLLDGRVAFVTGAARGIGLAVARRFCVEGASVVIGDVVADAAEREAAALDAAGPGHASAVGVDVTDEEALEAAAERTIERHGRVDCVVANAGILLLRHVVDIDLADWQRVIDINLTGAFLTAKVFARRLIAQHRGGRVILTSSLFGLRGGVENGAYSASKFGMIGLAQSLAAELAPHAITVNAVCPGQIDTDMMQQLFQDRAALTGRTEEAVQHALESRIPMGRLGTLDEVGDIYTFLASDLSSYVTGQSLVVDGGWQVG